MKISEALAPYLNLNTLVHIGAHLGQELNEYLQLDLQQIIYIEADPFLANTLDNQIKLNNLEHKVKVINSLIGSLDNKTTDFFIYNNLRGSSSIYKPTHEMHNLYPELSMTDETLSLKSMRLDTLLKMHSVDVKDVDALVLDIQGSEFPALIGAGQYLTHPYFIEVEVSIKPIYGGSACFKDIALMLNNLDYVCISPSIPPHGDVVFQSKSRLLPKNEKQDILQ